MSACGVLLCAGSSNRMGFDKLNTPLCGKTAIERSMDALLAGGCDSLVFVVSGESEKTVASLSVPVPFTVVQGGEQRTDSVRNGLQAASGDVAVIHDAARCFVTPAIVRASIEAAERYGSGVAAIPVTDTAILAPVSLLAPSAMAAAHSSETAPTVRRTSPETPRTFSFTSFA